MDKYTLLAGMERTVDSPSQDLPPLEKPALEGINENGEIDRNCLFVEDHQLGAGEFGEVWRGKWVPSFFWL